MYVIGYYSAIKKKEGNLAICGNVDGPRYYYTKWSKSDREIQISYYITHMWNLIFKMTQMNLFTKQKQTHRHRERIYDYRGKGWGEG